MKRLFLALAVLAFAGGARAQTVTCADNPGLCDASGRLIEMQPSIGYFTPSMGIAAWNKPQSIAVAAGGLTLVTINPDGTLEYGKDYTPDAAAKAFWDAVGLERKQRAATVFSKPSSAKLLPGPAAPADSE